MLSRSLSIQYWSGMGVTWAQPKPVADSTKIMIKASFPKTQILRSQIWNLWKRYKKKLRDDGFSVSKYKSVWYICYFINVEPDTFDLLDTIDGRMARYMINFKEKYTSWKELSDMLSENIDDPDEPDESDEPDNTWYHDMEHDSIVNDFETD